jgi:hypothetical protein
MIYDGEAVGQFGRGHRDRRLPLAPFAFSVAAQRIHPNA